MAQIATAWVLSKPGVTAPIIGTTSLKNLEDILGKHPLTVLPRTLLVDASQNAAGALDVKLTEEEIKYLEEPYQPVAILGHS